MWHFPVGGGQICRQCNTIQYNSRLLKISKLKKAATAITGYNIAYSYSNQLMFPTSIGGAKILTFRQTHNTIVILSSPEGAKLHYQLRWKGHGRIAPSLDSPLDTETGRQTMSEKVYGIKIQFFFYILFSLAFYRYITLAFPLGNLAALRTFRVLRALKTVAVVPGQYIQTFHVAAKVAYTCTPSIAAARRKALRPE